MSEEHRQLTEALDGNAARVRELVEEWIPVIHVRVARALVRRRERSRDVGQEVEDITQDVFSVLFADNGKVLRTWDPDKGLSLRNFVGLVAERHAGAILRSSRRSPWTESPSELFELDSHLGEDEGHALALESKDFLDALFDLVRETLTPRGLELFELLIVRDEPIETVCAKMKMSVDAVYAWRSRLLKLARTLGSELMAKMSSSRLAAAPPTPEDA